MIHFIYMVATILLTGVGQTLLKIGSRYDNSPLGIYVNSATITGYILFMIVTISSVIALRGIELKLFYALTSLNYVIVIILSRIILKENLSLNKIKSIFLIVTGIIIFNI